MAKNNISQMLIDSLNKFAESVPKVYAIESHHLKMEMGDAVLDRRDLFEIVGFASTGDEVFITVRRNGLSYDPSDYGVERENKTKPKNATKKPAAKTVKKTTAKKAVKKKK